MRRFFTKSESTRRSALDTPAWALNRITLAKEQNLSVLDLSLLYGDETEKLTRLPDEIFELSGITTLYLSGNHFQTIPESIARFQNLTTLDLSNNSFDTFPNAINQLPSLTSLDLSNNYLNTLPETITRLQKLLYLNLKDNPLVSPPIEIAVQGIKSIREYFRQLRQEGEDFLYEAKLLILGEGGAGKTTLANKILDSNYVLKDEQSTKGVDVVEWRFHRIDDEIVQMKATSDIQVSNWEFQEGEGPRFRVNIWDFGGQEIYHATHQFFLTKRSLYALVVDTRKDDTDFYYWLNIVELLSDGSPLLIIKNEKQDRPREINERQLKGQFGGLKEVLSTNLATNRGLDAVKAEIQHYLRKLPHIGSPLPKTWVRVRAQLEKDQRNYISLNEYIGICKENGLIETDDMLQLSSYLHDIGVFLHFQDEPLLKKTVLLRPAWGTDAVYKVLDNKTVIEKLGHFTRTELEIIWDTPEYETMRDELLQLMMKFKLCYEIPTQKGSYIAPQLLTENHPDYQWNEQENLLVRYTYEFMPKGILTQFIVIMHPFILEQRKVWKSGVVIEKDKTRAEVIEYYGKREIHVRVAGAQARDLLTIIRHELRRIHDTYNRLKYEELIQCNCAACKDNQEPHFYTISELLDFRANNQLEIQCRRKPYHMVNVMGLLGDLVDLGTLSERDTSPSIIVHGDYIAGGKTVADKNISISGSIIHGSVVAAESIQDSFNVIDKADIKDDLKEQLKQLAKAVDEMIKKLPQEKAEEAAEDMKVLTEQATKEKPNPKWYNVSIDGLIAAAQNLGKVGDAVIELSGKVRKILTGGLL